MKYILTAALTALISGNFTVATATPVELQAVTSTQLDQICKAGEGQIRRVGQQAVHVFYYERHEFRFRRGTSQSHHNVGGIKVALENGKATTSVSYTGQIGNLAGRPLGFTVSFDPQSHSVSAADRAKLIRIRDMALKFFEWRQVAQDNKVPSFEKAFPDALRPQQSDGRNFKFRVQTNFEGNQFSTLQAVPEAGICWLYQQTTDIASINQRGLAAISATAAAQSQQQQRQQNLSNEFQ